MKIDTLNWQILEQLQKNARIPLAEIARTVGITSPAVAERIKKMEDAGIISGYYTQLAYLKCGYQLKAIVTVKVFMGMLKPLLEKVREYKEVVNCYRVTGNENIIMEVVLKDQGHLEKFIDKLIAYGETKPHIILSDIIENAPFSG